MASKEVAVKKYVVRLSEEERARLDEFIRKGKRAGQLLTKARILLKADVSEAGDGWSDSRIAEALDTSVATVERTRRRQLVEEGFEAVLTKRRLKRGVFRSVADLQAAINRFLDDHNARSKPFQWTADPDKIIAAVRRGRQALDSIH